MADKKKVEFYLLCVICAILGSYSAKLLFDRFAAAQKPAASSPVSTVSRPASIARVSAIAATALPMVKAMKKEPAAVKKTDQPALVLNGVVFSPGSSYALINNRIVKEGDKIEGITVVRIAQDIVELQDGDKSFKLTSNVRSF
ncbi:MAG: hypothetical protein WC532_02585 [Candidatus Omnitrophota bacterium]